MKSGESQEYEGADCENHPQDVIIGKHVQVYFDPQQPDRFQTYHGSLIASYLNVSFPIFFGILFLGIALLMLVVGFFANRSQRPMVTRLPAYRATPANQSFLSQPAPGSSISSDRAQPEASLEAQ